MKRRMLEGNTRKRNIRYGSLREVLRTVEDICPDAEVEFYKKRKKNEMNLAFRVILPRELYDYSYAIRTGQEDAYDPDWKENVAYKISDALYELGYVCENYDWTFGWSDFSFEGTSPFDSPEDLPPLLV